MKLPIFNLLIVFYFLAAVPALAQPVVKTDPAALLNQLTSPPATAQIAYQRACPDGDSRPNAALFYKSWNEQIEKAGKEVQMLLMQSYSKNPMGTPTAAKTPGRAPSQQEAGIHSAANDLAQRMLADPELAQKIQAMSEKERHAYIAKLLSEKGISPASGTPNSTYAAPAGIDENWIELFNQISQKAMDQQRWDAHFAMEAKYEALHQAVRDRAEADIKKLPLIEMGEYGRDRDPEKVKAIHVRSIGEHRDLATAMLKDAAVIFEQLRGEVLASMQPFQEALKARNFGEGYDFGVQYQAALNTQMLIFQELGTLSKYAADITDNAARWEAEWRSAK